MARLGRQDRASSSLRTFGPNCLSAHWLTTDPEQISEVAARRSIRFPPLFQCSERRRPGCATEHCRSYASASLSTLLYDDRIFSLAEKRFDFQSSSHGARRRRLPHPSRQDPRSWAAPARRVGMRARPTSFIGEVHQAIRARAATRTGWRGPGRAAAGSTREAGAVAAALTPRTERVEPGRDGVRTRARRVVVKARVVKLNPQRGAARGRQFVSAKAVDAHLRYLERDGVTRDGEKGRAYSAERDWRTAGPSSSADARTATSSASSSRPRMPAEMADLRELHPRSDEADGSDLGTKLDWIAVDHHNTGHPAHPHHRPGRPRRRQDPQHRRRLYRPWRSRSGPANRHPGTGPPERDRARPKARATRWTPSA